VGLRITWGVDSFRSASDSVVLAAVAADRDAFEELFRRYRRTVLMYAARRCERPADVEDVVAETFIAVLEAAGRYDPSRGEVRAWLLGIAHNQLGLLRRNERRQRGLEVAAGREAGLPEDGVSRRLERISAVQEGSIMQRALAQLTDDQREALLLVSRDDLSLKEAAGVVGISAAAFRVRLFRARRTMQALMPPPDTDIPRSLPRPKEAEK
jgi:RNA polymerase sigma factor (sigma-70 family)